MRYLRKKAVAERYGVTTRTVETMVQDKRIPAPDLYNARSPLWREDKLNRADKEVAKARAKQQQQATA